MRHRLGPDVWKRFGVVLLSVAGSSGVAFGLKTLLHGQAHLLPFTLAVIASSWYGGLIPGLAATILSVVIADYFFIEPLFHIEADSALLAVFLVVGVSISLLQNLHRRNWSGQTKNSNVSPIPSLMISRNRFVQSGLSPNCS